MRVLAIDTALEVCAAAVLDTGGGLTGRSLPMVRGHAEAIMPLVATVMSTASVEFSELDRICPEHTILATNPSTLPVIELAMETGRPDRVCGVHFFNPAPVMTLVELVRPLTASEATIPPAVSRKPLGTTRLKKGWAHSTKPSARNSRIQ